MAKNRMRLKSTTFLFGNAMALSFALHAPSQATKAHVEWISLYNGNEAQFSKADRVRLLAALKGLGVEHREDLADREILVNAQNRALIQDLLAQVMVQKGANSK